MIRTRSLLAVLVCWGLASLASAQQPWLRFTEQTSERLIGDPSVTTADAEEKDYAWGDLDQDGDIDLVCVRKQPWGASGRRRNVLFMNEGLAEGYAINGVLVDRTAELASASDIAGDTGFLTLTNDRDVKLADVNGDGWLDVITAVTRSDGQPKHISHPRVYINLGRDAKGAWLGLQYEDARFPQLAGIAPNGFPHAPRFNHVAVGDVDLDGLPDLFFADDDMSPPESLDFGNRLLLNAAGAFVDVSATNLPASVQNSSTAVSSAIADMNGDGLPDLIKHAWVMPPIHIAVVYNQADNPGMFNMVDVIYTNAPTDFSVGDLNNDDRQDLVITEDFTDRYLVNLGNGVDGLANFQTQTVSFQMGSDDGFGGESVIADLNRDGWNDVIITDIDFDIFGCGRRAHIYRNLGNAPSITLQEQSPSVISASSLSGTHDVAVFDINGDGWDDIVLGRCTGMQIWIQQAPCPADISPAGGDASVGVADLLALITAWGPGTGPADVTGDGTVNVADLLAVISAWGPCP